MSIWNKEATFTINLLKKRVIISLPTLSVFFLKGTYVKNYTFTLLRGIVIIVINWILD